jgi:hypothetical protein
MVSIIIPGRSYRYGKTRSQQEENLRRDGMASLTEEQLDKCKYLERKIDNGKNYFDQSEIDGVK